MPDLIDLLRCACPPGITVLAPIAAGGQGSVFSGFLNGTPVALKVFATHVADPRRIDREIRALQAIQCPFLVRLVASMAVDLGGRSCPLIAYELLPGSDLRALLDPTKSPVSASVLALTGSQISVALEALWQARIVHRDVKPANIVQADLARYVLVDVGIARHIDLSAITGPGGWAGTVGYMSPEQALGRRSLTIASDVFSLGLTLYQLAAREHPFGGDQLAIGRQVPQPLASRRPDLPASLCQLIHEMLATPPYMRPTAPASRFQALLTSRNPCSP
jgi:serine/threonine protein kinase